MVWPYWLGDACNWIAGLDEHVPGWDCWSGVGPFAPSSEIDTVLFSAVDDMGWFVYRFFGGVSLLYIRKYILKFLNYPRISFTVNSSPGCMFYSIFH